MKDERRSAETGRDAEPAPAAQERERGAGAGVRVVALHLPEDEGEGLGFTLTRTRWDPYPWVREVGAGGRARAAGLRPGDCLLQVDGQDLLGLPVAQTAALVRGDGGARGVALLVWSCGDSPSDDPELLWSAGGGARGERSRRALGGVLAALACCVCGASATAPRSRAAQCARGHLYCAGCRARLQRCALCREPLPAPDSPQAGSLVAEQVFEAIAAVYDLKEHHAASNPAPSGSGAPHVPPVSTPKASVSQRNSPLSPRRTVQFGLTPPPHHGSDSTLNRPKQLNVPEFNFRRVLANQRTNDTSSQTDLHSETSDERARTNTVSISVTDVCDIVQHDITKCLNNPTNASSSKLDNKVHICHSDSDSNCKHSHSCHDINRHCCQTKQQSECCRTNCQAVPLSCHVQSSGCCQNSGTCCKNTVKCHTNTQCCQSSPGMSCGYSRTQHSSLTNICQPVQFSSQQNLNFIPMEAGCNLQHRLVTRLRPASSLADLRATQDGFSKSLNNIHKQNEDSRERTSSAGNLARAGATPAVDEVYLMASATPVLAWVFPQP